MPSQDPRNRPRLVGPSTKRELPGKLTCHPRIPRRVQSHPCRSEFLWLIGTGWAASSWQSRSDEIPGLR